MKKKFLPARLVSSTSRWYITFHQIDPKTGKRVRFNRSYDLNLIKDKRLRKRRAQSIVAELNQDLLPNNYPFEQDQQILVNKMTLEEGMDKALAIKATSDRESTNRMYRSVHSIFLKWAKRERLLSISLDKFKRAMAFQFMDYVKLERKVSGKTYNNYLIQMKALFYALYEREFILNNPFTKISKLRETKKQRRGLSQQEKRALVGWMKKNDKTLLLAVILMYYCGMRPAEILRLRLKHFNVGRGFLTLPGEITKNKKSSIVTIPNEVIPFLLTLNLHRFPLNYLIFGQGLRPHPTIPAGTNSLRERHKKAVKKLVDSGAITQDTGVSLYSWKDTGVMDLAAKNVNIITIKNHLRHEALRTTQKYTTSFDKTEDEIKRIQLGLLDHG